MTDATISETVQRVLATDLDGTLIPLDGDAQHRADLQTLAQHLEAQAVTLVYVTGRHLELAVEAIEQFHLPRPAWLISDVGTSIYKREGELDFQPVVAYDQHQGAIVASTPVRDLQKHLESIVGLRRQEPQKQGRFKASFYTDVGRMDVVVNSIQKKLIHLRAPWTIIASVDPFNGDGLIDLLPANVSKSYALTWWVQHYGLNPDGIVFAGDSGNDLAALTAGFRAIVVGNADRELVAEVKRVHEASGWTSRLHIARGSATSGVLEGCREFGLLH